MEDMPKMPKNLTNSANQWLSGHGMVSAVTINIVMASIKDTFDCVNHVDMTIDNEENHVIIEVYVPFLEWIFRRTGKILKFSKDISSTYIQKHTVETIIKRYKGEYNLSKTTKRIIGMLSVSTMLITAAYFGQLYNFLPSYDTIREKLGFEKDEQRLDSSRKDRKRINKEIIKKK